MKSPVIALVLAASVGAGCTAAPGGRAPATDGAPTPVSIARVEATALAVPFEAGGAVRSRATAPIASRMMAPIATVAVRPGDRVRRGAVLVTLDGRDIQANRTRAGAASLAARETALAAEADVRAAESAVLLARATHQRIEGLHARRSATAQELDQAVAGLAAAEAQRTGAQARLAAANAARGAAQASAEGADIGATYAVLSAPFDGVVTERHADPGSMAMPGVPLLTVEDPTALRLEIQLDEARAALVAAGQTVDVRVDSAPTGSDEWIQACVSEIARVDPESHSFLVKIDLPPRASLRSGLFGRARFAGPARRVIGVPAPALVRRGQLTFVFVVDADGRARLRPVSTGASAADRVEVLAGVHEGDVVVTNPPASLSDGARVSGAAR